MSGAHPSELVIRKGSKKAEEALRAEKGRGRREDGGTREREMERRKEEGCWTGRYGRSSEGRREEESG